MIFNFIFLTFSFFSFFNSYTPPEKYRKGEYHLNRVLKKSISKIKKKYHLTLAAIGGGTDDEGIWLIDLMFDKYGEPIEIEQARNLIANGVNELLLDLNNDERLRPYLKVYPLTSLNVSFAIFFHYKNGEDIVYPFLSLVASYSGRITYKKDDEKKPYKYKFELFESYEEALEILKLESSNYKSI